MKQSALMLNNVSVSYGENAIVRDINLDVRSGEFFGLIGLNGAGKTTLIKAILNLRTQSTGDIQVFDRGHDAKQSKIHVTYLPERFDPPWFLTGVQFLEFSLRFYNKKLSRNDFIEAAERLYLDPKALDRLVHTYSKGMRQKLGLLATILSGCDLMILDEPMSGLDPMARAHVKDMLIETKKQKRTVFFSSHILADMDELCDRVAILHDGIIQYVGKPSDLKKITGDDVLERAFLQYIEKKKAA